jgi:hypothetical protein
MPPITAPRELAAEGGMGRHSSDAIFIFSARRGACERA